MKSLVLASVLGSAAIGYSIPALAGPIHFQTTKPYSMFGQFVFNGTPTNRTIGVVPLDFVMTDVLLGSSPSASAPPSHVMVTVNGNPVLNCGLDVYVSSITPAPQFCSRSEHLTSGFLIPAGSTVGVQATANGLSVHPITLVGYLQ